MRGAMEASIVLLLATVSNSAVITGACEWDVQCGAGTCCAISLWLRGLRVCTPLGRQGEECHPLVALMGCPLSLPLQACEWDVQCGAGTCCAISLWLRGLRVCTPLGRQGEECHPSSHKVPSFRKRQHHSCPCSPNLLCSRFLDGRYRCSMDLKNINF
ncbi:Prokineticin-1 [Heterocephalus glaber]|uniref:Prokineticin-1 n=1 Tax=Heterocephalus glaber TaxID=10181 RepID=G5BD79_HETGA|nr:Prokineticin-1 [Heterocephalus glaber]